MSNVTVYIDNYIPELNEDDINDLLDLCLEACCVNLEKEDIHD